MEFNLFITPTHHQQNPSLLFGNNKQQVVSSHGQCGFRIYHGCFIYITYIRIYICYIKYK